MTSSSKLTMMATVPTPKGKAKKPEAWANSKAKAILYKGLLDGSIPLCALEMGPQDVYLSHPEFAKWKYDNFRSNLNTLRKTICADKKLSRADEKALVKDRELYPKKLTNSRGEPVWDGSVAQKLLHADVAAGKHRHFCVNENRVVGLAPKVLFETSEEYKKFPLKVFRKHVDQEERRQKYLAYLKAKSLKEHANSDDDGEN
jgi:hypothetical protein